MKIIRGFSEAHRDTIAHLYWQAFGGKLGRIMGPDARAEQFIASVLDPSHALSAVSNEGAILGVAGFKTAKGELVGGKWSDMRASYGTLGSVWRLGALALLERDVDNTRFLVDGIFVAPEARGQGVGTRLLDGLALEARKRHYDKIRLDVINTNLRARTLYEREGFEAVGTTHTGIFSHLFGFESATTMVRTLR